MTGVLTRAGNRHRHTQMDDHEKRHREKAAVYMPRREPSGPTNRLAP